MKIVKNDAVVTAPKAEQQKYNPNLKYEWTPEDTFQLTGEQFGIILNAFRGILNTPEAAKILLIKKANDAIESVMIDAVNNGVIKEMVEH